MDERALIAERLSRVAKDIHSGLEDGTFINNTTVLGKFKAFVASGSPGKGHTDLCGILNVLGNTFYNTNAFKSCIIEFIANLTADDAVSTTQLRNGLQFIVHSCLLHPSTALIIVRASPDVALSGILEIFENYSSNDGLVLEKIALSKSLVGDSRLKRKARSVLNGLSKVIPLINETLLSVNDPRVLVSKLTLLAHLTNVVATSQLSSLVQLSGKDGDVGEMAKYLVLCAGKKCSLDHLHPKFGHLRSPLTELYITLNEAHLDLAPNLVRIRDRVSYKRSNNVVVSDSYVALGYSEDVLCKMLYGLDVSVGQMIVGECSKSFYIKELANRVGVSIDSINHIYTDDTTDVKTLVGNWICTENVGEFVFNYGIISVAMKEGRWLIFDSELSDSIAFLVHDVSANGELFIPELSETVYAHEKFAIFVTCNVADDRFGSLPAVEIPTPSLEDILSIARKNYSKLEQISNTLIHSIYELRNELEQHRTLRVSDIFKVFKRLQNSEYTFKGYISSTIKSFIIETFYTIFLAGITCNETKFGLLTKFARRFDMYPKSLDEIVKLEKGLGRNTSIHLKVSSLLSSCYRANEPVLLVGDTGTGKTAIVQSFAKATGNKLLVYVFNEQSESSDLVGNFFPDNIVDSSRWLFMETLRLHLRTCQLDDVMFLLFDHLVDLYTHRIFNRFLKTMAISLGNMANSVLGSLQEEILDLRNKCNMMGSEDHTRYPFALNYLVKPLKELPADRLAVMEKYKAKVQADSLELKFRFEDGILVEAMKNGYWILLDEINLAPCELLQRLNGIVANKSTKFELYECGNKVVNIHPNFRIFACMNPPIIKSGDILTYSSGKKELPESFKCRFTEIFVDQVTSFEDLSLVASSHVENSARNIPISEICNFYVKVNEMCKKGELEDGSYKTPTFTLRNFVRAIHYTKNVLNRDFKPIKNPHEAVNDALLACFCSSLGPRSLEKMEAVLPSAKSISEEVHGDYVKVEGYWIKKGDEPIIESDSFIVTPNIRKHVRKLSRILSGQRVPILLEGPTAAGKTSLVQYLCNITGHKCVRVNNHEHTEISEYIGQFVFDSNSSKLTFNYGVVVNAMKYGHWLILDELNLAPSQILEALNRILDDNREIYIPETREVIKCHPEFMIFATQNPANSVYGGRKQLSRAFCNRFVQIYVEAVSPSDLELILHKRCKIAMSRSQKIVKVYESLSQCSINSMIFEKANALITLRDLIKWANRVSQDDSGLSYYGWCIIAEKLRNESEKQIVKESIEKNCPSKSGKVIPLCIDFKSDECLNRFLALHGLDRVGLSSIYNFTWFDSVTDRVMALILRALDNKEPVLLVGETGIGKTTICQLIAKLSGRRLNILNCHKNTEASDFIGGFRPTRNSRFHEFIEKAIDHLPNLDDSNTIDDVAYYLKSLLSKKTSEIDKEEFDGVVKLISHLINGQTNVESENRPKRQKVDYDPDLSVLKLLGEARKAMNNALFEWVYGPLSTCLIEGEWFLADEISLADDAVLEKMNSALEMESTLSIPEAGGETLKVLHASANFRFLATMNPGGDYGKRELSPALLNRFTQIYIPELKFDDFSTVKSIVKYYGDFSDWIIHSMVDIIRNCSESKLTLRDLISWSEYIARDSASMNSSHAQSETVESFIHGLYVSFLDSYANPPLSFDNIVSIISRYNNVLPEELERHFVDSQWIWNELRALNPEMSNNPPGFSLESKTSLGILGKILRALRVNRPVLLEGSPGVGKTASVNAIAQILGIKLVRINLSEHTDIIDLFGSDLPCMVDGKWQFLWHNGPLLDAVENGYWIILDELNLASQQILEGLNALLDHRRETFIPELNRFVKCANCFRLFASQNPAIHGNGRKFLPKSFLNRFTKIYVDKLEFDDYCTILASKYPGISRDHVSKIVTLFHKFKSELALSQWEWNLRDCMRFCGALEKGIPSNDFNRVFHLTVLSRLHSAECFRAIEAHHFPDSFNSYTKEEYLIEGTSAPSVSHGETIWMFSQWNVLNSLAHSVKLYTPILVTGPSQSGKVSTIRKFAQINGKTLVEIPIFPSSDLTDIIGCFEQTSRTSICNDAKRCMENILDILVPKHIESNPQIIKTLVETESVDKFLGILSSSDDLIPMDSDEFVIAEKLRTLNNSLENSKLEAGNFKWVDSPLIRAIERGEWVLLRRIQDANPAILDRLNSLLEENGQIVLNESGQNRVVIPHKDFRIFMIADETLVGRISKAFRNRCLEINVNAHTILKSLYDKNEMGYIKVVRGIMGLDCTRHISLSMLLDGVRIVLSIKRCTIEEALVMSLTFGTIKTLCNSSEYNISLTFLKKWALWDNDLVTGLKNTFYNLPEEILSLSCTYMEHFSQNIQKLQLVINYLSTCWTDFECLLFREACLAKISLESHAYSLLWFLWRSSGNDSPKRFELLKSIVDPNNNFLNTVKTEEFIGFYQEFVNDKWQNIRAIQFLNMITSGKLVRIAENFPNSSLDIRSMDPEKVDKLGYLDHLLCIKSIAPVTIGHVIESVFGGKSRPDLSVDMIIGPSLYTTDDVNMEFLRLGLFSHGISENSTKYELGDLEQFINLRVAYLEGQIQKCPLPFKLETYSVECERTNLVKFFNKKLWFLNSLVQHLHLSDKFHGSSVHEYAMEILRLYVQIQHDIPTSSLILLINIIIALRTTDKNIANQINLEACTLLIQQLGHTFSTVDPLKYMSDLICDKKMRMEHVRVDNQLSLDNTDSLEVINFWSNISLENGIPNLVENVKRVKALESILNSTLVDPTCWSNVFSLLLYISPHIRKVFTLDLESIVKAVYHRQACETFSEMHKVKDNPHKSAFIVEKILKLLEGILQDESLICDLWEMSCLYILLELPNLDILLDCIEEKYMHDYRVAEKESLEDMYKNFAMLDSLADGESTKLMVFEKYIDELAQCISGKRFPLRFATDLAMDLPQEFVCKDSLRLIYDFRTDVEKFTAVLQRTERGKSLIESIGNFSRYLEKKYLFFGEILKPVLLALHSIVFSVILRSGNDYEMKKLSSISKASLESAFSFPYNPLMRLNLQELVALTVHYSKNEGKINIYTFSTCLLHFYALFNVDYLITISLEPLKYLFTLLSGMVDKQVEDSAISIKLSLFQKSLQNARKSIDSGVFELFPNNERVIAVLKDEFEGEHKEEDDGSKETGNIDEKRINKLLVSILNKDPCGSPEKLRRDVINAVFSLSLSLGVDCMQPDRSLISRAIMAKSSSAFGYSECVNYGGTCDSSFYNSCNTNLTLDAWKIIAEIKQRVKELEAEFTDNPQLGDVEKVIQSITKMKVETVTQSVLTTMLEVLLAKMEGWNYIAHSKISLKSFSEEIQNKVIGLREKELGEWQSLVLSRLETCENEAYASLSFFVEMCSSIFESSTVESCIEEILQFVTSSPIAHFSPILKMVKATASLFKDSTISSEQTMRSVLANMQQFLMHWEPIVNEKIDEIKKETNLKVLEIIKTVKRSGQDYVSIRESIEKQKDQVTNEIRRFDQTIRQPFTLLYNEKILEGPKPSKVLTSESKLISILRENVEYVQENKNTITRLQCTRISSNVCDVLSEMGFKSLPYKDNVMSWIDFGKETMEHTDNSSYIMESLHILRNLNAVLKDEKAANFKKNIDLRLLGYLAFMFARAQEEINQAQKARKFQESEKYANEIMSSGDVRQASSLDLRTLFTLVDEVYEGLMQLHSVGIRDANVPEPEFKQFILTSPEYRLFLDGLKNIPVRNSWVLELKTNLLRIKAAFMSGKLENGVKILDSILNSFYSEVTKHKDVAPEQPLHIPLECLYLTLFIESIAHVKPVKEENNGDSTDQWTPGTGLDDGTAMKNISEDVEYDDNAFDNKDKDVPQNVDKDGPNLDMDIDFEGEEFDVQEEDRDGDDENIKNEYEHGKDEQTEDVNYEMEFEGDDGDGGEQNEEMEKEEGGGEAEGEKITDESGPGGEERESGQDDSGEGLDDVGDLQEEDRDGDDENIKNEYEHGKDEQTEDVNYEMEFEGDDGDGGEQNEEMEKEEGGDENRENEESEENTEFAQNDDQGDVANEQEATRQETGKRDYSSVPYGVQGESGQIMGSEENEERIGSGASEYEASWANSGDSLKRNDQVDSFFNMMDKMFGERSGMENANDLRKRGVSEPVGEQGEEDKDGNVDEFDQDGELQGLAPGGTGSANQDDMDVNFGQEKSVEAVQNKETGDKSFSADKQTEKAENRLDHPTDRAFTQDALEEMEIDTSGVSRGSLQSDTVPFEFENMESQDQPLQGDSQGTWKQYQEETAVVSTTLCEQMRIILEPTKSGSMQGDYKTGKRISIKKLMTFIASNYQRDKIWLRRTKPSKRDYCIFIAIDNSKSMANSNAGTLALKSLVSIYEALSKLDVGDLTVCKFGGYPPEILLDTRGTMEPFKVLDKMTFDEETRDSHETGLPQLLKFVLTSSDIIDKSKRILIIISDGKFNKTKAQPWIQSIIGSGVVPLLVILDPITQGQKSILQMKQVTNINGKMKVETFFQNFPFPYYAIIHDIAKLPNIITDLLRQWFALSDKY
ncbi:ATPase family member protein [Theileria equi strain WA]|uniref:Midasin n=1 Tax=Theileria equi strain WA TaxID=1537102 RepID=L1LDQ7_THEEQ|nr:ATPase family member protein [Theileria equi strain WA]EKX73409.1 ATPase family member protein [Theileria equi strain WA]|eukprot:XP_004832861.1 ATPase family member protein [Theileria equi strain WA]